MTRVTLLRPEAVDTEKSGGVGGVLSKCDIFIAPRSCAVSFPLRVCEGRLSGGQILLLNPLSPILVFPA